MPQQNKRKSKLASEMNGPVAADEKIARLLGLIVIQGIDQKTEQVMLLRSAGFQVSEVASMLGITEQHVAVATHQGRKLKSRRKVKKKK